MSQINEPHVKQSSCSYCGDAPINHTFSFIESWVAFNVEAHLVKPIKIFPNLLKDLVDLIPVFLFETLALLKMTKFSSDINKANTFRSKIIWEEAKKRGILMEQVIFFGKPLDQYRLIFKNKNKKKKFYFEIPLWHFKNTKKNIRKIFSKIKNPLVVKPRIGSRGRHTITNINSLQQLQEGISIAGQICSHLIIEEHLKGNVCRATLVNGAMAGFYMGRAPTLFGDGQRSVKELIEEKDKKRQNRVEPIRISKELHDHIGRSGFAIDDILPDGVSLPLSHRIGRLFGGTTCEMLDELHPSFISILEKATKILGLSVVGFDAIIPDPTKPAYSQHWGIIECNTLPFIDLHYYALEGTHKNIAGMIWDMWGEASLS